ncbi:MAG: hypothetical protein C5B59_09620 [Bacteroidetes bacterium]|nr:MAG: hypothetical protein C5B59_09620 [Bacteroidota bacterium]
MKADKAIGWSLVLLVVIAAFYRIIPDRTPGFAPQLAIAIFAGAIIKDRKLAIAIPVLSMFFSDMFYQILYSSGLSSIPGFYEGQWQNYVLIGLMTLIGMPIKRIKLLNVLFASLLAPTVYFILSNFVLWAGWSGTRGLGRPKTWSGLMMCYQDATPFFRASVLATLFFSLILFGSHYLLKRNWNKATQTAFVE